PFLLAGALLVRTLRAAAFRFRYLCLINVRLQWNTLSRRYSGRAETTANGIAPADSGCNLFGKFLAVGCALRVRSFSRVGQKPAFHEHCGNGRLSQDIVTTATHSSIARRRAAGDIIMNRRGERQAVAAVKISFYAAGAASPCGVK